MQNQQTHIAFRCPECGETVFGFVGQFAMHADLLRLKCNCGASAAEIRMAQDGKVRLSVPCVLCKKNHEFTVSQSIFYGENGFIVRCPYSGVSAGFMGSERQIEDALRKNTDDLEAIMKGFEAEDFHELQPQDMNEEDIVPDSEIYDIVRFVIRELEEEHAIDCPCHGGKYDLRFTKDGIQVFCPGCGASAELPAQSAAAAQEYVNMDSLTLR